MLGELWKHLMQGPQSWIQVSKTLLWLLGGKWITWDKEESRPIWKITAEVQMRGEREQQRRREEEGLGYTVQVMSTGLADGLDGGGRVEEKGRKSRFIYSSLFRPAVPSFSIYLLVFLIKFQFKALSR